MSYTPELVAQLMPAIWDMSIVKVDNPRAPDPDMPKVKADPKVSGTVLALLADIRIAWATAPILPEDRQALLLTYGLDWSQQEIADIQAGTQQAVSRQLARGIAVILFWLNGKPWEDGDENEDENDDTKEIT